MLGCTFMGEEKLNTSMERLSSLEVIIRVMQSENKIMLWLSLGCWDL